MRFKAGVVKQGIANGLPGTLAISTPSQASDADPQDRTGLVGAARPKEFRGSRPSNHATPGQTHAPTLLAGTRNGMPISLDIGREVARVLAALAPTLAGGVCAAVHVTTPAAGNGVSTVAHTLAAIAGYLPSCRPLLLSMQTSAADAGPDAESGLPDLIGSYRSQGVIEVMNITALRNAFHAARLITGHGGQMPSDAPSRPIAGLWSALQHAYDLIILDCPPVPAMTGFLPIAHGAPQVLLVLTPGATRASEAVRSRVLIERMGGQLLGAVMNHHRNPAR